MSHRHRSLLPRWPAQLAQMRRGSLDPYHGRASQGHDSHIIKYQPYRAYGGNHMTNIDPHYGVPRPPSAAEGRWIPPDLVKEGRARRQTRARVSTSTPGFRDRVRAWPWLLAGVGALFILYSASAGSSLNASRLSVAERGVYIAVGLGLLVLAAVVLALRRVRSR